MQQPYFAEPELSDYPHIAALVNKADQIYHSIYSLEEFHAHGCASEGMESLIEGSKRRKYLCAYDEGGKIIGYASYRLKNPQTFWLSMLYVDPMYQKSGIGSRLLAELEKVARLLGASVAVLETDKKAIWAIQFYQKNDYQILSDKDLLEYPFDKALNGKQVEGRYILGKIL